MAEPVYTWEFNVAEPPGTTFVNFAVGVNADKWVFAETGGIEDAQVSINGVQIPQVSTEWAPELWVFDIDNSPNNYRRILSMTTPAEATQNANWIRVRQVNAAASVPLWTSYDLNSRTATSVIHTGTTTLQVGLLKLFDVTRNAATQTQFWGQGSDVAIQQLEVSGDNNPNALVGNQSFVQFDDATAKDRFIALALAVPADLTPATVQVRLSIRYTFT